MSRTIKILTIGKNKEVAEVLLRLINKEPDWIGILAINIDEAMMLFKEKDIDLVLFGSGIDESEELQLRNFFKNLKPNIILLQHYGGGSGLLKNEIYEALGL